MGRQCRAAETPGQGGADMTRTSRTVVATIGAAVLAIAACAPGPTPGAPARVLLSLGDGGVPGNGGSSAASVSADGRYVTFNSYADNLVAGDGNGLPDTFVRDTLTGDVVRIATEVYEAPRMSGNGRYASYVTSNSVAGVYDRVTGTSTTWSAIGGWESAPLVPDDGSVAIGGVAFLFGPFGNGCLVRTLSTGATETCPATGEDVVGLHAVSANGRYLVYDNSDTNGDSFDGIVRWDRWTDTTEVLDVDFVAWGSVEISNDGRYLTAPLYTGIDPVTSQQFDLVTDTVTTLPGPPPDADTFPRAASPDGRRIVLYSTATNLAVDDDNGAPDAYVWDTVAGTVELMTPTPGGPAAAIGSASCGDGPGQFTPDGRLCTVFAEPAVAADTNGVADAYLLVP